MLANIKYHYLTAIYKECSFCSIWTQNVSKVAVNMCLFSNSSNTQSEKNFIYFWKTSALSQNRTLSIGREVSTERNDPGKSLGKMKTGDPDRPACI